ncbi:MAG: haloacid dehalogenase [Candidatus Thermoplasmatota archaeon]|nr:haloacid dehalogenase [Candidatus Thermoplasmatota archaeon]
MNLEEVERIAKRMMGVVDEKDELRERALKETRDIIKACRETISALHDNKLDIKAIEGAKAKLKTLKDSLRDHGDILYSGYILGAAQELTEAFLFYRYMSGEEPPQPEELGVEATEYLLGLCDFTGELRRHMLCALIKNDLEGAERDCKAIERIYKTLAPADYPRGLINLKQKVDACRAIMEKSLEDLARAKQSSELTRLLSERSSS